MDLAVLKSLRALRTIDTGAGGAGRAFGRRAGNGGG